MNILHTVQFYYPSIGGMQEVVRQISELLVRYGHTVTVATTKCKDRNINMIHDVRIKEFNISGNLVQGLSGEVEEYRNFIKKSNFDIVTNFAAQQCMTDAVLPHLDEIKARKVFVPTGFSALFLPEFKHYFESLKSWMKKFDKNIFLSQNYRDINFARKNGLKNFVVIPNGASADEFLSPESIDIRSRLKIPNKQFLVLNVGSHTSSKGHAEAIQIFKQANMRNTTFIIVGNKIPSGCEKICKARQFLFNFSSQNQKDCKRLFVTELSRKELIAAYREADLFLFTSQIECSPLVLFECMASKTPFLTTDVGNAKEIIEWSNAGILLPTKINELGYSYADVRESAKVLEDLYNNPKKRKMLSESGFEAWKSHFTWEIIAKKYEQLYKSLLSKLL